MYIKYMKTCLPGLLVSLGRRWLPLRAVAFLQQTDLQQQQLLKRQSFSRRHHLLHRLRRVNKLQKQNTPSV